VSAAIHRILDSARWAPSGDNTQPWRFEVVDNAHLIVHGSDTRRTCVYDLDGRPSQISLGALLETIAIAATGFGLRADATRRLAMPEEHPTFDVHLVADPSLRPSALIPAIAERSVQRQPFGSRRLTAAEESALGAALAPGFSLQWHEGIGPRWRMAMLMFHNAKLRLTMHEAYLVHRDVIAWRRRFSEDRVPDQALGADPLALRLMRWAMQDWSRVRFLNRWLAGTWLPRLQMDLLPGLRCGAHFVLMADRPPRTIDDYVTSGRQVQRLWLTATRLGLQQQPEITPLVFSRYVREGRPFTSSRQAQALARRLAATLEAVIGPDLSRAVWIARIGHAPRASSRSVRRSLHELMDTSPSDMSQRRDDI